MITAVHLYPTTMNTYGDRGNVAALTHRARERGLEIEWLNVEIGQVAPAECDLVFMGGGQDRVQHTVAEDLMQRKAWLQEIVDGHGVVFAVCAGLQLLGRRYVAADGSELAGLGLLDLQTIAGDWRLIGNVVATVTMSDGQHVLAGFENHGGRTLLSGCEPLGTVLAGNGNNGVDGGEGARSGNVIATYLHGPVLPKNAWLTDHLLALAVSHSGGDAQLARLDQSFEDLAQNEAVAAAQRDLDDQTGGLLRRARRRIRSLR